MLQQCVIFIAGATKHIEKGGCLSSVEKTDTLPLLKIAPVSVLRL